MTMKVVPGGWYVDMTTDGHYVVLMKDRHLFHDGHVVALPPGNLNLLYVRLNEAGTKFVGVGHQDDHAWEWDGDEWSDCDPAFGPNACIYDAQGDLHVVDRPGTVTGSQGWRYLADDGRLVTCDETYADPTRQIWEYTTHGGDITVGQGGDGPHGPDPCIVLIDGTRRLLESGTCRFIRFRRSGDRCSICFVKEGVGAVLISATRAELAALPLADISVPKPPEPPQLPNPPEPPMPDIPDCKSTVERVRATYPTPLGETHARFLLELAPAIFNDHGLQVGLLKKSTGTFITLPDSTKVAQDIICFPDGIQYDCLFDGENKAIPIWGPVDRDDYTPDPSRYYAVKSVPDPPDPPTPDPEPHAHPEYITQIEELHTMLGGVLRRLDEHDAEFGGIAQLIEGMLADKLAHLTVAGTVKPAGYGWLSHSHGFSGTVKPKQE